MSDDLERRVTELERLVKGIDGAKMANTPTIKIRESIRVVVDAFIGRYIKLGVPTSSPPNPESNTAYLFASSSAPYYKNNATVVFGAYVDRVWSPANAGKPNPALTLNIMFSQPAYVFPATGTTFVDFVIAVPRSWAGRSIASYAYWACDTAAAGNVYFSVETRLAEQGSAIPSGYDTAATAASGNPGQYVLRVIGNTHGTMTDTTVYKLLAVRCIRYGDNAADTYASNAYFFGVEIVVY